ncbi:MAG TPA: polysaccharide biosynthesis tyrosine autokinase [Gemmatimonadaceae bacterium]|nr:polysaccharide biosynthesis tyrosine autokinase [Gemmatimonadaceae bacterium]
MADLVPFSARAGGSGNHGLPGGPDLDLLGPEDPKSATEFVGIREYLGILRRHWWVVLIVLAVSVAYTANQVLKEAPRYRAVSTVRLVDARRAITGGMGVTGTETQFSGMSDPIESQIQVLMSRAVASVAVDLKGLRLIPAEGNPFVDEIVDIKVADDAAANTLAISFSPVGYTIHSGPRSVTAVYGVPAAIDGVSLMVSKQPSVPSVTFNVVPKEAAVGHALGGFSPSSRPKTDILDLSYTGSEPWEAKRIANAMAEAFQLQNASSAQQLSRRRRAFLEDQLQQTDAMLAKASGAYSAFRSGRQVFSSATRFGAQEAGLIDIDTKKAELGAEKRTAETLLAQAKATPENMSASLRVLISQPGIASNPIVQQLYAQLTQYEKARDDLLTAGQAPTNPDVIAINSLLPATAAKMIDAVESHVQSINARLESLERLRASGASQIATAPAVEAQEQQLTQQLQTIQRMADQLRAELQQAKMAEAVEAGQVEVVQLAQSPGYQIPTKGRRKLTIGVLVGLMLGFGAAILVDGLNNSIRRRSDIERLLHVPGLAVIPRLSSGHGAGNRMTRALPGRKSNGKSLARADHDLVTVTDVRSSGAEAYRTLRTNLMFSQAVQALRTLVITSAGPSEGKTTTSSNLSVSFAQQGMRILLVDCDLRRARLHKIFGCPREPGLSDLVLGYKEEDAVTRATSVPGLYVIPSGQLPPNPAELLGSEAMRRTLTQLMEGYDLVVIDTPPLLAASDAAILATLVDGVILVLRAGQTESAAAIQSMQQLNAVGARVVGAVLNDPDMQVPRYGAYYRYEYSAAET